MNHSKQGSAVVNTNLVALELRSKPLMSSFKFASYILVEKMTPVFLWRVKNSKQKSFYYCLSKVWRNKKRIKRRDRDAEHFSSQLATGQKRNFMTKR